MFQPELSANLKFFPIQHCGTVFTIPLPPAIANVIADRFQNLFGINYSKTKNQYNYG